MTDVIDVQATLILEQARALLAADKAQREEAAKAALEQLCKEHGVTIRAQPVEVAAGLWRYQMVIEAD
jgi:predicted transcriptional regulator